MKKRPSYCAAATLSECDHPFGCSACTKPSATSDWRGLCSISNRCLFAGCFYPLGDMCVFCLRMRPAPALGTSPLQSFDAVARPASSKQGLSIRVAKKRDQTGGYPSGPHSR